MPKKYKPEINPTIVSEEFKEFQRRYRRLKKQPSEFETKLCKNAKESVTKPLTLLEKIIKCFK